MEIPERFIGIGYYGTTKNIDTRVLSCNLITQPIFPERQKINLLWPINLHDAIPVEQKQD